MQTRRLALRLVLTSAALATFACDGGTEPPPLVQPPPLRQIQTQDALLTANQNVRSALVGAARAGEFTRTSDLLGGLLPGFGDTSAPCLPEEPCEPATPRTMESMAAEIADEIADLLLHEANVESSEPTKIVLRVTPERACPEGRGGRDADCVRALTQVPVRLELSSRQEGNLDVAVLVGEARSRVATLELYRERIALEVDLAAARDAAHAFITALGEDPSPLAGTFRGRVRLELAQASANVYTASASVMAEIEIATTIEGERFGLRIGQAAPAFSVRLDGNAQTVTAEASTPGAELELPFALIAPGGPVDCTGGPDGEIHCDDPEPAPAGSLVVQIPAAGGRVVLDGGDALNVTNLRLDGTLRVTSSGQPILALDVNAADNRRFDLEVRPRDEGLDLTFRPLLDVSADLDLRNLPAAFEVPSWAADELLRVRLDGHAAPAVRLRARDDAPRPGPDEEPSSSGSVLEVLAGRLVLSSRTLARQVAVEEHMCLNVVNDEAEHPLEVFGAGVCE